jgi:heat shock protein HtpX
VPTSAKNTRGKRGGIADLTLVKDCVRFFCVLIALGNLSPAQFTPVERNGLRADLQVELAARGELRATLTVPALTGKAEAAVGSALASAAGCRAEDLRPVEYQARFRVHCAAGRAPEGGLHATVRLSGLKETLRALGVGQLGMELTFPKLDGVVIAPNIGSGGSYRVASYAIDTVPEEITIDAGIDRARVRTLGCGIAGLMLLPFVLMLARPRTLLHLIATTQTLFLLGWAGWTWVLIRTHAWTLCELAAGNTYAPLLLLAAPIAAVWIGSELGAIQYARLAPPGANVALYRQGKFWIGSIVAFFFMTIFGIFAAPDDNGMARLGIGLVAVMVAVVRLRAASRGASHPLAAGELRERIFALAAQAGARIRGVTILTGAETRPPAAFATRFGGILLTDGLLKKLSRREVDAIVCHEFSHTGPRSRVMMYVLYALVISTTMAAQFMPETPLLFPILIVAAVVGFKAWRRGEERAADRDSVRWSRDPEAMISGLARVSLASGMPLDWGAPMSWMLSHPSTGERLRLIAAAGGVAPSRVAELIEQARAEAADHYAEPGEADKDAAFSPRLRQRLKTSMAWYALAAPAIFGVGITWAIEAMGIRGLRLFAISAPVSMAAFYWGYEMIVGKVREEARRRAVARHGPGIYVGLSPAAEMRIYEGMYHYDFGLVRFSPGAMEFVGDRTRFTLDSRLAERVWMGAGPRHWTPRKVVYVECRNPDETRCVFSLQSFEARMWPWTAIAARKLYQEVEAWRAGRVETLPPPLPCEVPQVQGDADQTGSLFVVVKSAGIYAAVALTMTSVLEAGNFERGFDWEPALVSIALGVFAGWPRLMKARRA